ncbi:MAG: hypothetical protein AAFY60_09300 [Myxococcota bacterium]
MKNEGNSDGLLNQLKTLSLEAEVEVFGINTSLATRGTDLGGDNFVSLKAPRVAILAGDPVRSDFYGFTWHLLDQHAGLRLSRLNLTWLTRTDLSRYNVLIVPHANGLEAYRSHLGSGAMEALKAWVQNGGTLIAMGNGAELIAHPRSELTRSRFRRFVLEDYPPVVFGLDPATAQKAGTFRAVGLRASPGEDYEAPVTGWSNAANPYGVFPVYGRGAAPFVASGPPPFEFPKVRHTLDVWAKSVEPNGKDAKKKFLKTADARLRRFMPSGVYLNAQLDPEHWLGFGTQDRLPVYFRANDALIAEAPAQTAVRLSDAEDIHVSGLLWPEAAGRIAKTAYLVRESSGRGQVILFNSEPAFRGNAFATQRLLLNAVVLGPGLGTAWPSPW